MIQRKIELALLLVTVAFIGFCAGLFLGRRHEPDTVTITTELASAQAVSTSASEPAASEPVSSGHNSAAYVAGRLNINAASAEDLAVLPGIGEKIAQRIVAYREQHGSFTAVEDLRNVSGIGEKRLEAILEYITVGE